MIYYSTFINGTAEIIQRCMKKYLKDYNEIFISQDIIIYKTDRDINAVKNLQFVNNTFVLIHFDRECDHINKLIRWSEQNRLFTKKIGQFFERKKSTYWLYFDKNNSSISVSAEKRDSIEKHINRDTNLMNRPDPLYEIWFQVKREGYGVIGIRITRKPDYQRISQQGELRAELSFLLNFVGGVNKSDVIIDPFCGSGSIGIACAKNFRYKRILNADKDITKINQSITDYNFRDFNIIKSNFTELDLTGITKVITDPPWGLSETMNVSSLYTDFFKKFKDIKTIVMLVNNREIALDSAVDEGFLLLEEYEIYIGGQKAFMIKFGK